MHARDSVRLLCNSKLVILLVEHTVSNGWNLAVGVMMNNVSVDNALVLNMTVQVAGSVGFFTEGAAGPNGG